MSRHRSPSLRACCVQAQKSVSHSLLCLDTEVDLSEPVNCIQTQKLISHSLLCSDTEVSLSQPAVFRHRSQSLTACCVQTRKSISQSLLYPDIEVDLSRPAVRDPPIHRSLYHVACCVHTQNSLTFCLCLPSALHAANTDLHFNRELEFDPESRQRNHNILGGSGRVWKFPYGVYICDADTTPDSTAPGKATRANKIPHLSHRWSKAPSRCWGDYHKT